MLHPLRCPTPSHTPRSLPRRRPPERAQATIELLGALPVLLLAALCCVQALLLALGVVFAQTAADRAARGATSEQARSTVPSGWRDRARVTRSGDEVRVVVRPPVVLPGADRWLAVTARSEVAS